jgi:ADP-ribose pyrophosphatase YjhB (NUDIX family)
MPKQESKAKPLHAMPFVRLELAVLTVKDGALHVLLGKRTEAPYAGRWALPGGAIRIDLDGDLVAGCRRIALERLGTELLTLSQVCAVGARRRDPRAPWALSVVYRCMVPIERLDAAPGNRMEKLEWFVADQAAADANLAFDHSVLVAQAVQATRSEFQSLRFPSDFLPEQFTLADLQTTSEAVLGRRLDKSSFRRRLDDAGCVEALAGAMRTGAFRPAQLYGLRRASRQ